MVKQFCHLLLPRANHCRQLGMRCRDDLFLAREGKTDQGASQARFYLIEGQFLDNPIGLPKLPRDQFAHIRGHREGSAHELVDMLIGKTRCHSSIDEHLGIAAYLIDFAVTEETHHLSLVKGIQPDFAPVVRETIEADTSGVEKVDEAM